MPYKDPERKKEWEKLHRAERSARRRELRRIEVAPQENQPKPRGALPAHSPKVGLAVGGLAARPATFFKKEGAWWLVGCVILALAFFFIGEIDRIQ